MSPTLFMVEIIVADWPKCRAWYRDVLGLIETLVDETNQFCMLNAGSVPISLKAGEPRAGAMTPVFKVRDLEVELERLAQHGVMPIQPPKVSDEGYRGVHIHDCEGNRLTLFEWTQSMARQRREQQAGQ